MKRLSYHQSHSIIQATLILDGLHGLKKKDWGQNIDTSSNGWL